MKDALDLKSKSGVHRLISALEERGFIRRLPNRARALEIVRMPKAAPEASKPAKAPFKPSVIQGGKTPVAPTPSASNAVDLPLYGRIAAGTPIEAISDSQNQIEIPPSMISSLRGGISGEHYALEVAGDSMIEAGIIDESGNAAEYANITLLSPIDSTIVGHGVSNENGSFVIPCNSRKVLARITYVGYKTISRIYSNPEMGIIKLQPETMIIKGVVVKGDRPQYKMSPGGVEVAVEHTLLSKMANTFDVLNLLPRVSVNGQKISVFGKGTPIVYINNKRVNDNNEIVNITPDNIKSISVITSPGAEYSATVQSVIRIKTIKKQINGISKFSSKKCCKSAHDIA
jgi:hypothetical protein